VNPYAAAVRRLGRYRAVAWALSRVLPPIDALFVGRRRSPTSLGTGFPLCYLSTSGRRTGEPRTVPLLHVADGERVVLIASNWGRRRGPAWALNLEAEPAARVSVGGIERSYTARPATPEERSRYWADAVRVWPGYDDYRERAGRELPIFVLEPAAAASIG
jgi:deazaflavin-dependent oxidoreductase (nitroreductase family)